MRYCSKSLAKSLAMPLALALSIGAAALQYAIPARAEDDGWTTLLDSSNKGEWSEVGKANWEMKDGVLTVDKRDPYQEEDGQRLPSKKTADRAQTATTPEPRSALRRSCEPRSIAA